MNMDDVENDVPPLQVLHKQLECLAMGVIGLSSLVLLKEPTPGSSRQKRLAQEQDLLGHLKSVRHWITHRQAPGGWDPKGLASVALKCQHGNPPTFHYPKDDTGKVLPQLKSSTMGHSETPRSHGIAGADHQQMSMLSTHMTSVDSSATCQTSTSWPDTSRNTSRNLPIKSAREQAYARIAASGSPPPPPGNVSARQRGDHRGRPIPLAKGKPAKPDPEDFSGLFLDATGQYTNTGGQVSQLSTAEGFTHSPDSHQQWSPTLAQSP